MGGDVCFDPMPVVLVVADSLAVGADREQSLQLLHLSERLLQVLDALRQAALKGQDTLANAKTRPEFLAIERLGHEVVGPTFEPGYDVVRLSLGSQQHEVRRQRLGHCPDCATDLRPFESRHHPVENRQRRGIINQ